MPNAVAAGLGDPSGDDEHEVGKAVAKSETKFEFPRNKSANAEDTKTRQAVLRWHRLPRLNDASVNWWS
jgi:hypothetical protein